jgi:hypothetical protein
MSIIHNSSAGWIHLKDGPAGNKRFFVARAPVYLRLVQDINGKWDVLDLIDDEPTPEEEVFVYRQINWVHVRANDRSQSGYHYEYTHHPITSEQKAALRYQSRWQSWARMQAVT